MSSKKIIIISRSIYPQIAPRPFRATELAIEFARQGHHIILYGMVGDFNYLEFENETGVKVKSLGKTFFSKKNSDDSRKFNIVDKVLQKLFGRILEFPDIELVLNTFNALKNERDIDLLISIAIPYPIHWGVALFYQLYPIRLKKTTWVADCGDPYMGNPFHKKPFYFKYIEKWFCKIADYLTVPVESAKKAYYPEFRDKIKVIPQGFKFNELDLEDVYKGNFVPTFVYAGAFYPNIRDPRPLLDFLSTLEIDFRFIIFTKNRDLIKEYQTKLKGRIAVKDYIPRTKLLLEMAKADFLVNLENHTNLQSPSKLIDYALCKRPVLSVSSSKNLDVDVVIEFLSGKYHNSLQIENIQQYNITNIVYNFLSLSKPIL